MEGSRPSSSAGFSADDGEEDLQGRYKLLALLGRGAYGSVYKALEVATGHLVAVKIIAVSEADTEELKRIQKEVSFLADCDHPNVVKYLASYRNREALWIVMEYCGGGSVSDIMHATGAPLEERAISYICMESLKGLAYLHSLGKVHRDIKCGNILLTEEGEVKLADFGVAAQLTSTMSKRNTFIGTPHWMAPEVIQESRYDGKVDIWALGISTIEMAEITPPRWTVHPLRVIFQISREPPPQLQDKDQWSPLCQDFVAQCLQKDPRQRPTARYLLQHRFVSVSQPGPNPAAMMLPLVQAAQQYLATQVSTAATLKASASSKAQAFGDTGQFSWRHAGDPGGPGSPPSTADLGPGSTVVEAGRLKVMTRDDRGPGSVLKQQGVSYNSGTLVVHGEGVGPPASTPRDPQPVRGTSSPEPLLFRDLKLRQGSSSKDASGTLVMSSSAGRHSGDDYLEALRSAMGDGGREKPPPVVENLVAPVEQLLEDAPQQDLDTQRIRDRVRALYNSGTVLQVPLVKAADIPALALLQPAELIDGPEPLPQDVKDMLTSICTKSGTTGPNTGAQMDGAPVASAEALSTTVGNIALQNLLKSLQYHEQCLTRMRLSSSERKELVDVTAEMKKCLQVLYKL